MKNNEQTVNRAQEFTITELMEECHIDMMIKEDHIECEHRNHITD